MNLRKNSYQYTGDDMTIRDKKSAQNHDDVLEEIADALDIPQSKYEKAKGRYESIGDWLDRDDSTLSRYDPAISPQGSFLLGTVIRPLSDADEYDVDLVCELNTTKTDFTQKSLKEAVGYEIHLYAEARNMANRPEEGRRCWTLHYADEARFHMDVLPALPDASSYRLRLEQQGHTLLAKDADLSGQAIAITDRTLPQYAQQTEDWPQSNPMGYAAWFRNCMAVQLEERKMAFAEREMITASVDEIPDYKVKTPLQRSIQLLKRHRDTRFVDDPEHKPISIIITTLAAHSYNNESTISDALRSILTGMDRYIEYRGEEAWIANPVNPNENFADKWAEEPKKRENFYNWLEEARRDFALYLRASQYDVMPDVLKEGLGTNLVDRTLTSILAAPATNKAAVDAGEQQLRAAAVVQEIQRTGTQSKPWAK